MYELSKAIRKIAWGYLFLHFHINLGTVDILPDFLGFLWILQGIWGLRREVEAAGLLEPFGIFLVAWNLLKWLAAIFGGVLPGFGMESLSTVVSLFLSVIPLYFHFQLQTDLATVADRYETERGGCIRLLRTVYTVLTTGLFLRVLNPVHEAFTWISTAVVVISLLAAVVLCIQLFGLARDLANLDDEEDKAPTKEDPIE